MTFCPATQIIGRCNTLGNDPWGSTNLGAEGVAGLETTLYIYMMMDSMDIEDSYSDNSDKSTGQRHHHHCHQHHHHDKSSWHSPFFLDTPHTPDEVPFYQSSTVVPENLICLFIEFALNCPPHIFGDIHLGAHLEACHISAACSRLGISTPLLPAGYSAQQHLS